MKCLKKPTKNPTVKVQPDDQHHAKQKPAHQTVAFCLAAPALSVQSSRYIALKLIPLS